MAGEKKDPRLFAEASDESQRLVRVIVERRQLQPGAGEDRRRLVREGKPDKPRYGLFVPKRTNAGDRLMSELPLRVFDNQRDAVNDALNWATLNPEDAGLGVAAEVRLLSDRRAVVWSDEEGVSWPRRYVARRKADREVHCDGSGFKERRAS